MPNKCTNCGKIHPDDAPYLLKGCDNCGSHFFFYVRKENLRDADKAIKKLSKKELNEIERDIRDIVAEKEDKKALKDVVVLDLEAVRVVKPGKYEIDLINLLTQKPIVIRIGSGKYEIDLSNLRTKWRKHMYMFGK